MSQHKNYLIQFLESIGAPLLSAVTDVCAHDPSIPEETRPQEEARRTAELLSKTVQSSIEMGKIAGLNDAPNIEELRLSLAALASLLIAAQYRKNKRPPSDADLQSLNSALQSVMAFSDNFTLSKDSDERLKALGGRIADSAAMPIHFIEALIPVINAASVFSFGQPETELVKDIGAKLTKKAAEFAERFFSGLSEDEKKLLELHILRALSQIYVECHKEEVARMGTLDDAARSHVAPDTARAQIWAHFDRRAAMLESLTDSILPGENGSKNGAHSQSPEAPSAPVAQTPVQPSPPPAKEGNPMAMFAKPKPAAKEASAEPAPVPESEPESLPPTPPPETAPPAKAEENKAQPQGTPNNPMSFFSGKKSDDNS